MLMRSLTPQQRAQIGSLAPNQQRALLERILNLQTGMQQQGQHHMQPHAGHQQLQPGMQPQRAPEQAQQALGSAGSGVSRPLQGQPSLSSAQAASGRQASPHPSTGQLPGGPRSQPAASSGLPVEQPQPGMGRQQAPAAQAPPGQATPSSSTRAAQLAGSGQPHPAAAQAAVAAHREMAGQQLQRQLLAHLNPQQMMTLRAMPRVRPPRMARSRPLRVPDQGPALSWALLWCQIPACASTET